MNGVASGTYSNPPNPPAGNFAIGTDPGNTGSGRFNGLLDEVRIFTFTAGQFSTNDLLLNVSSSPYISNVAASEIGLNGALLSAAVTANGGSSFAWFEYGLTTNYGSFTPTNAIPSSASLAISNALTGLQPGTLYHFRAVAENGANTSASGDLTFTTTAVQVSSPLLTGLTLPGDGSFQFGSTSTPGASFTVLATTKASLPLSNWTLLSNVVESPAGRFQFTDPQARTNGQRFYRVRSP